MVFPSIVPMNLEIACLKIHINSITPNGRSSLALCNAYSTSIDIQTIFGIWRQSPLLVLRGSRILPESQQPQEGEFAIVSSCCSDYV